MNGVSQRTFGMGHPWDIVQKFFLRSAHSNPRSNPAGQSLICSGTFLTLLEWNIDNHMATWKAIETVSGNFVAVSSPAAQNRPGTHGRIVWEGPAADQAEALKCAEKADSMVDLEWMRIRYERDHAGGSRFALISETAWLALASVHNPIEMVASEFNPANKGP